MAETTKIEWCDSIDPNATGRTMGAYKSAATKCGVPVEVWISHRVNGLRHCFRCRQWKPSENFSIDRSRGSGLTASCRECASDASTASRSGLTLAELHEFRKRHDHRCAICGRADGMMVVDHDHHTKKLRGLLCQSCNTAIGLLGESPDRFASALSYLEVHRG
jgi:hypothetical protein